MHPPPLEANGKNTRHSLCACTNPIITILKCFRKSCVSGGREIFQNISGLLWKNNTARQCTQRVHKIRVTVQHYHYVVSMHYSHIPGLVMSSKES